MVFTLEVVQTIILTKSFFDVFGYGFGEPESYDRVGAIWFSVSFLSGIGQYSFLDCGSESSSCILETDISDPYSGILDTNVLCRPSTQALKLLPRPNRGFPGVPIQH